MELNFAGAWDGPGGMGPASCLEANRCKTCKKSFLDFNAGNQIYQHLTQQKDLLGLTFHYPYNFHKVPKNNSAMSYHEDKTMTMNKGKALGEVYPFDLSYMSLDQAELCLQLVVKRDSIQNATSIPE